MNKGIKYTWGVSIFFMLTLFSFNSLGQSDTLHSNGVEIVSEQPIIVAKKDTSAKYKEHSPKKATILSAILPGAGQVYNRKYWKVPIVYGAIGSCLYLAINNNMEYNKYFGELVYRTNYPGYTLNPELTNFSTANLTEQADYHRKWRDNFFVFTAVTYGLNIIDANVDGHLFNFDVSDDLTLNISPYTDYSLALNAPVGGISLRLSLK